MRDKAARLPLLFAAALTMGTVVLGQVTPVRTPVYQVVVDVDPVALDVAVTDQQGRAVTNLKPEDFILYEDGQPQSLRSAEVVGMPYSILVLVDRSAQDQKSDWPKFVLKSVDLFLRNLRGPDRLAIAGFDDRVAVLLDWRPSKNGNVQKVMIRKSDQHTRFFEALNWASEEMDYVASSSTQAQPIANGRRGVIVFSDGRDFDMYPDGLKTGKGIDPHYEVPASVNARFEKSKQLLGDGGVPFYFVAINTDRQLADKSAQLKYEGWMRFLGEVRTRIEHWLRHQVATQRFRKKWKISSHYTRGSSAIWVLAITLPIIRNVRLTANSAGSKSRCATATCRFINPQTITTRGSHSRLLKS